MKAADIDIIKRMLVKARKKLATARTNFDNDQYDDAISRAYYGVFHAISSVLLSKGLHFSSHGQTIGEFNREFIKTKEFPSTFSEILKKLFRERQIGDYDVESYLDADIAKEDLEEAENYYSHHAQSETIWSIKDAVDLADLLGFFATCCFVGDVCNDERLCAIDDSW